jgi:hypothetical protein
MQAPDCHGDWLIDYADGALPADQVEAAKEHLAACPGCRREVAALQSSGEQLQQYFVQLHRTEQCSVPLLRHRWMSIAQRAATVAASVALVWVAYSLAGLASKPLSPLHVVQLETEETKPTTTSAPLTQDHEADDIAAEIARETQIARLKAAITILHDEPGMSERSAALQQYLLQTYQVDYELPSM